MRSSLVSVVVLTALMGVPLSAAAQADEQATTSSSSSSSSQTTQKDGKSTTTVATKVEEALNPRFVRTLTNVQIEVTLMDQVGTGAPVKKTVSMIVSSGNWGKVRSSGAVVAIGEPPYGVELNVDARPFVAVDGQVQVELTMQYAPLKSAGDPKVGPGQRPSGINQSQTVILQSGKPLIVAQAADPVSDRKVIVEVKATILK